MWKKLKRIAHYPITGGKYLPEDDAPASEWIESEYDRYFHYCKTQTSSILYPTNFFIAAIIFILFAILILAVIRFGSGIEFEDVIRFVLEPSWNPVALETMIEYATDIMMWSIIGLFFFCFISFFPLQKYAQAILPEQTGPHPDLKAKAKFIYTHLFFNRYCSETLIVAFAYFWIGRLIPGHSDSEMQIIAVSCLGGILWFGVYLLAYNKVKDHPPRRVIRWVYRLTPVVVPIGYAFALSVAYSLVMGAHTQLETPLGYAIAAFGIGFGYTSLIFAPLIIYRFPHDPFLQTTVRWINRRIRRHHPYLEILPLEENLLEVPLPHERSTPPTGSS